MTFHLNCLACEWQSADGDYSDCPRCGGTINVIYESPEIHLEAGHPGIWKYASHLPVSDVAHQVSLGEGNTPLVPARRLGTELGLPGLHFKIEGGNPTGSYKDRVATVGVSRLLALNKRAWAATSSGNAGASLAAYGARAGVEGHLFTIEKAAPAKLAQIMSYGPRVYSVQRLGYDPEVEHQTWANIRALCEAQNWLMLVTARAFSPHAMEGVKTIAFEVCNQLGNEAPDVVYVPVGGGGLLSMCWKGFVEWRAAGQAKGYPRMVAVQPAGCDSIAQAWRGNRAPQSIPTCESTISGLQLTAPPDGDLVLRALRDSEGWAVSVPDEETYRMQAQLARREGLFVEPAAAITVAAVKSDLEQGRLRGNERVVCLLTGVGFKDTNAVQRMTADYAIRRINAEDILTVETS